MFYIFHMFLSEQADQYAFMTKDLNKAIIRRCNYSIDLWRNSKIEFYPSLIMEKLANSKGWQIVNVIFLDKAAHSEVIKLQIGRKIRFGNLILTGNETNVNDQIDIAKIFSRKLS